MHIPTTRRPEEVAAPAKLVAKDGLRPYQRQSLAFMLAVEKGTSTVDTGVVMKTTHTLQFVKTSKETRVDSAGAESTNTWDTAVDGNIELVKTQTVRGGWLADEVGMGKTACCIALILANPCKDASNMSAVTSFRRQKATAAGKERPLSGAYGYDAAGRTKYSDALQEFTDWKPTAVPMKNLKLKASVKCTPGCPAEYDRLWCAFKAATDQHVLTC